MQVTRSIVINDSPEDVFGLVSDPGRYPEFFQGVTKWKPLSDQVGEGARFRVLMQVGAIEAGGVVRVTEWTDPTTIAWESESGIRQRGRWLVKAAGRLGGTPEQTNADRLGGTPEQTRGGVTELTLEVEYSLSGGPAGWLVERMTSRIVGRHAWATLLAARRLLEQERAPKLHV